MISETKTDLSRGTILSPFHPPVVQALERALLTPGVAAFDCDGTLWDEDLGEEFLRFLVRQGHLTSAGDLWAEYEARVARDRAAAYGWAVQVMEGLREDDIALWCRQVAGGWPHYRPAMVNLLRHLEASGWQVWLVSASNRWIIEAARETMGLGARVLAIEVLVSQGRLTGELVEPLTYGQGKVEALRGAGVEDFDLAGGDSLGDAEMLMSAGRLALAVGREGAVLALDGLARERGWAVQVF